MFKTINFLPGKITYDSFDIDFKAPFDEQVDSLREDLFQVSYSDKYTIDIGWFPDGDPQGSLVVRVIENYDWNDPIYLKKTSNLETLNQYVKECVMIIREKL